MFSGWWIMPRPCSHSTVISSFEGIPHSVDSLFRILFFFLDFVDSRPVYVLVRLVFFSVWARGDGRK